MTISTFALQPLSKPVADAMRLDGGEVYVADSKPGYPCRQCLRDAEIGEELILLSHDPFADGSASPYRSASPIFVHRHDCADSTDQATVPDQLALRQLSVRSFDENEMMIKAAVIDGTDLELTIDAMFADELSSMLHVHNAERGCYAVKVQRCE